MNFFAKFTFFIEMQLKEMPPEDRKAERQKQETPVWDTFWKWLDTVDPLGGSKLEKAVNYAYNHKDTLMNYLLDGRCEISNNAALCPRYFYPHLYQKSA